MLNSIIDFFLLFSRKESEVILPGQIIQSKEIVLTPSEYKRLYESDPTNIQNVSIIPPLPGSDDYGLLRVQLHRQLHPITTSTVFWRKTNVSSYPKNNLTPA